MNILSLDTETIDLYTPYVFNIGYCIIDNETGEVLKTNDLGIKEIINNKFLFKTAFYYDKNGKYYKKLKRVSFNRALKMLVEDLEKYRVEEICGYNSNFDFNALQFTCEKLKKGYNNLDFITNYFVVDILQVAREKISYKYLKDFEIDNRLLKKRISYSAENVYKFLIDLNFIEKHTALKDSINELEIYMKLSFDK